MNRRRWLIALAVLVVLTAGSYAILTHARLKPFFTRAHVAYPPRRIAFLIFNRSKVPPMKAGVRF